MELTTRQLDIISIIQKNAPITGEHLADLLGVSRPTIRSDLALLVMLGYIDAKPKVGYFLGKTSLHDTGAMLRLDEMKVRDVQGLPVVLRENALVSDAVVALFTENVGSLMIVDTAGSLAGVVSRKDLLKVTLGNASASTMPISLVMTRQPNIITVQPDDSVLDAARKMIAHQVDSLPVVEIGAAEAGRGAVIEVVGRVTKTSMTKLLLDIAAQSAL